MMDSALTQPEFDDLMAALSPFESSPIVAVGVSGGCDSSALCFLANVWAKARGGRAIALTVDHGLRPASSQEAHQVSQWMAASGIEHHTLCWKGIKPSRAIQEHARIARRQLMTEWCRESGILHLLLAHHVQDQAETYLMRIAHKSGPDGLAGMASVVEDRHVRVLRPLLTVSKHRLSGFLHKRGQAWIDDPSNDKTRFERVRTRNTLAELDDRGMGTEKISHAVRVYASERKDMDALTAKAIASGTYFHPFGFARIDQAVLTAFGPTLRARAMAKILRTVGGDVYEPNRDAVIRAMDRDAATLAGCRLIRQDNSHLVCRESRNLPEGIDLQGTRGLQWDNRFYIQVSGALKGNVERFSLKPLGKRGWRHLSCFDRDRLRDAVPEPARYSLPVLFQNDAPVQVASYRTRKFDETGHVLWLSNVRFQTPEPVLGGVFPIA